MQIRPPIFHFFCPYRVNDYGKLTEIDLEAQVGPCGAITCIEVIGSNLVAVVVSSGRLFLCSPSINNGQVISELGNNAVIHCLACRTIAEEYDKFHTFNEP